jgi:hypothetical protein
MPNPPEAERRRKRLTACIALSVAFSLGILLALPALGASPSVPAEAHSASTATRAAPDPDAPPAGSALFTANRPPQIIILPPAASAKSWEDWVEKAIQLGAVVIGGIWVWANYLLNRTHRARLEGRVMAEVLPLQGGLVKIVLGLRNVGLSKVDLMKKGTAVRIFSLDPTASAKPIWRHRMTVSIWESVDWVEPGESCEEQHILKIPLALRYPIKFELYVICQYRSFPLRRRIAQTLRGSYVLPPLTTQNEVPT